MNTIISEEFLAGARERWKNDKQGHAMANSIITSGPMMAGMNFESIKRLPFTFSVDAWNGNVTDQGQSLRCWAFASLNNVRQHAIENMEMKNRDFELSQNFIYFYDQLEKSSNFLNRIVSNIDKPLSSPEMQRMIRNPIMDNGQWYMFADLADKYGVVPKDVMPDTWCSPDTRYVTRILGAKLRVAAKHLRDAHEQGADEDKLARLKEQELSDIYGILCRFLSEPPETFTWGYEKDNGEYVSLENVTPRQFFTDYCKVNNDDYIFVIHHPSKDLPFMRSYYEHEKSESGHGNLLNVDMDLIKQMTIAQLKGGEQVVMGCDVAKLSNKPTGYMALDLYDFDSMFGCDVTGMNKEEWLEYKNIKGTHIMAFAGVNLGSDGKPDRWKVQNSYGKEMGINGYYVMDDNWFDFFVVSVVINKKYAPAEVLEAYAKEPVDMGKISLY